ncbi:MAG: hypothetical protein ACI4TF_03285 [Oliverpabstia sp.]
MRKKEYKAIIAFALMVILLMQFNSAYAKQIVVYSQKDSRWSNVSYGKGPDGSTATISSSGCGILSYVNAVYYMTGNFIQPSILAKWSVDNGYRINGVGTSLSLYKAYANAHGNEYGFKYAGSASSISQTNTHLKNGGAAIISVPNHLMALVDYDSSNVKYLILDSYKSSNRGTYSTGYRWLTSAEFTGNLQVSAIEMISPVETGNNPQGMIDSYSGGVQKIGIAGWAFDADQPNTALEIHVYIGTKCVGTCIANKE